MLIAVLALGVAAVWGLLDRPADWRTAGVVVAEGSGALYVVVHGPDRLVPVPNLASARLVLAGLAVAGGPAGIRSRSRSRSPTSPPPPRARGRHRRRAAAAAGRDPGATGLVGVRHRQPPARRGPPLGAAAGVDDGARRPSAPGQALGAGRGLLLRDRFDGTWLVHDGVRSRLDLRDPAVVVAFDLEGQLPRPVSTSLLNTLTEGPAIVAPAIAGRGEIPAGGPLAGELVGGVVRLVGPGTPDRWYVVQREGVQEVPEVVARLVRLSDADPARASAPVPVVSPGQLRPLATARGIAVSAYPDPVPRAVPMAEAPTTCASADGAGAVVLTVGAEPPATAVPPTTLAQADGSGDRVDAVALPGGGVTVRAVPAGRPDAPGSPTVVSGAGTTSAVPDPETAAALGLGEAFPPAPGAVVGLLPVGPVLSITDALAPLPAGG
ncbi:type VII secretion protein EccB [Actinomycetospora sp. CA-053990]|uniref:type VII secretion protein EccB n=1 Tax=Actinomycetospora sp. CA-053990 TaxID=3239891 RepID=UPI003D90F8A1